MTRLVHLTDLHFGLHRAELVAPLREAILSNRADAIIVSGDLTHRAVDHQFWEAMTFVRGLGPPFMIIPGNHDLPARNPIARLVWPFAAYRAGVSDNLTPMLQVGRLRLFGMNTADPLRWRGGVIRTAELEGICQKASSSPADTTSILVCHHPLLEPPGFERGETRNAGPALTRLADAGVRVVLSGHLHHWSTGLGIDNRNARPVFHMQTGTALCARPQERDHGFAVLDFDGGRLSLTPWIVDDSAFRFEAKPRLSYVYQAERWHEDN